MPKTPTKAYRTRSAARAERALVSSEIVDAGKSSSVAVVVIDEQPRCAKCDYKGRLYRPLYEFYREESTRCKRCLEHVKTIQSSYYGRVIDKPEWYAPLRINEASGLPWGDGAPWDDDKRRESFERWFALEDSA